MLSEASTYSTFIQLLLADLESQPNYASMELHAIIERAQAFRKNYTFKDTVPSDDIMFELLAGYIDLNPHKRRTPDSLQRRIRQMGTVPSHLTKLLLQLEQQLGNIIHQYTNYPPIADDYRDPTLVEHINAELNTVAIGRVVDDLSKLRDTIVDGHKRYQTKITNLLD